MKKTDYTVPKLNQDVWNLSSKKSQLSGKPLSSFVGTKMHRNCFAHVLPKGMNQYPHFRLFIGNIFLLTPDEHHLFDNGTEDQRKKYAKKENCNWAVLNKLYDQLKDLYESTFPAKYGTMIMKYSEDEVMEKILKMNHQLLNG